MRGEHLPAHETDPYFGPRAGTETSPALAGAAESQEKEQYIGPHAGAFQAFLEKEEVELLGPVPEPDEKTARKVFADGASDLKMTRFLQVRAMTKKKTKKTKKTKKKKGRGRKKRSALRKRYAL